MKNGNARAGGVGGIAHQHLARRLVKAVGVNILAWRHRAMRKRRVATVVISATWRDLCTQAPLKRAKRSSISKTKSSIGSGAIRKRRKRHRRKAAARQTAGSSISGAWRQNVIGEKLSIGGAVTETGGLSMRKAKAVQRIETAISRANGDGGGAAENIPYV